MSFSQAESEMPWTATPARLDVGVVGPGRAGSVLAAALNRVGHHIKATTAISEISKLRVDALLPRVPIQTTNDVVKDKDLVLLTVPDDVLPELIAGLAATRAVSPGTFVMHAAGRYGTDVLAPLTDQGCLPLAIHPVMTFTGTSVDLNRLHGCPFGVTAPEQLRPVAEALVVEIGGDPVWIPEGNRGLYHAALAFGANNLMVVVNQMVDLLSAAGVEDPVRLASPLLSASLDNAVRNGDSALTGPISRGDVNTVRAHLETLDALNPLVAQTYRALARLGAERAAHVGMLSADKLADLLLVLGDK